ncbi:MAG: SwmB domain-containing protein, partial [Comamonadaceae bacterium]
MLGPDSAPSSLGLLFILSLVHELGHAQDADTPLALENQAELQKIVEIIQDSYPEISAQLFGTQVAELSSQVTASDATFNAAVVSSQLTELEASGYLNREETQRLANALNALDSTLVLASTDTLPPTDAAPSELFAQASDASATPVPSSPAAAAPEAPPVDIETLPATGAGPLAFALGPLLAGGGAAIAVAAAASGGGSSAGTTPAAGPTLQITDNVAGTLNSAAGSVTYTFTFSAAVTGFTSTGIEVLNGTKGAFTAVSASVYSLVVTPGSGFTGNISVNVAAGVATDAAGHSNSAAATSLQAVDTAAPVAPTFALAIDNGTSPTDGITSVGTVSVTGIEAGATWQYSTNGGSTWSAAQAASTTSFTLANATYAAGAIQVRQTDLANNTTLVASSNPAAITVDTTPPAPPPPPPPPPPPVDTTPPAAPSFALASDTGASASDGISSVGTVNVSGVEVGATWQYSTNGGTSWSAAQAASTTSFTLAPNATYAAGSIQLRQTDAANNVTVTPSSNAAAITLDNIAPVIQAGMSATGGGSQLVLNYDSTLDALHAPAPAAFVVTVNGTVNTVSTVTVSGSTVTLGLAHALLTNDSIVVSYTDATSGNDSNATQDLAGNDATSVISGKVADGYVRGAQLYLDANGNGLAEASEILTGVVTDANGNFFRPDGLTGALIALGGFNIDTGIANTMALKAPAGATMISPLTTLVQAYIESHPGASAAAANTAILTAMHLPTSSGINLSSYDPIAALAASPSSAEALAVQKVAAQVATLVQLAAADPNGQSAQSAGNTVIVNLLNAVSSALSAGNTVDLTSSATISTVLGSSTNVTAAEVVHATTAISGATDLAQVSTAQSGAINHTADITPPAAPTFALATDSGASATDGISNVGTVNVTGTEAGATWQYSTNGGTSWSAAQAASTTSFTLGANTTYAAGAIQVRQTDAANNVTVTPSSNAAAITVDSTAPLAPAFALATDNGTSSTDGITSVGTINVTGIEAGATWQYSTNGGTSWSAAQAASVSSFTLANATYAAGSIQVRQTDLASNTTATPSSNGAAITV